MKAVRSAVKAVLIVYHMLGLATASAVVLACAVRLVPGVDRLTSPAAWIALAPILYLVWLILLVATSALNMQIVSRLGWQKPRRFETHVGGNESRLAVMTCAVMMRASMIWSLPGTRYLLLIPLLDRLLLHSYSPSISLGRDTQLWGLIIDPDLTTIGDGAVIGGDATLSAHAMTTKPDGRLVYMSAPIHIGRRAVVGANSRVALGASIGDDAVVLPGSNVLPYTQIPANQVWGGDPAQFVRLRDDAEPDGRTTATALKLHVEVEEGLSEEIQQLVADVLGLPVERVSADFCRDDCAEWDSLAQMAIAAAIYNRFGLSVDSQHTFCLSSIAALCDFVRSRPDGGGRPASVGQAALPANPELLPLLDTATATRLLARLGGDDAKEPRDIDVVIASTFTADQVVPALVLWSRAFGIRPRTSILGFDRVHESLLDPSGPLRAGTGLNVVLARPEDLVLADETATNERVDALLAALENCAKNAAGRLVVASLPPVVSDYYTGDPGLAARIRSRWNSKMAECPDVDVLDLSGVVERLGITASRSQSMELAARSPYSAAVYQELGRETARLIRKRRRAAAKVLALDADNTLWGGVVAEDGPAGVQVGPDGAARSFQMFQQAILKLRERGILLVLVSRNEPDDVWAVFDRHPGMLLRRSHFSASRINWKPKSENLRELAAELNLGLDSFVFMDDDAVNRSEVEAHAPGVTVVPMPADPADYCRTLSQLWVFDSPTRLTAEDRDRAQMVEQEQHRQKLRQSHADLKGYLLDLKLRVEMREATTFDLARIAQLEQKTNQFNLSLKRRDLDQIKLLWRTQPIYVVHAADRFGDYGLVGTCIMRRSEHDPTLFILDTFLLSCRSLGRGVEEAVLHGLMREAHRLGGRKICAEYVPGPRNEPVREFLVRSGFIVENQNRYVRPVPATSRVPEHVEWVVQPSRAAG